MVYKKNTDTDLQVYIKSLSDLRGEQVARDVVGAYWVRFGLFCFDTKGGGVAKEARTTGGPKAARWTDWPSLSLSKGRPVWAGTAVSGGDLWSRRWCLIVVSTPDGNAEVVLHFQPEWITVLLIIKLTVIPVRVRFDSVRFRLKLPVYPTFDEL